MSAEKAIAVILAVIAIITGIFLSGYQAGKDDIKLEAREAGVIEYYLDGNDAKRWRWVTNCPSCKEVEK